MSGLTWTREGPAEPGWYWVRGGAGHWIRDGVIVCIEIYPRLDPKNRVVMVHGHSYPPVPPDAEWAGPIPGPAEREGVDRG